MANTMRWRYGETNPVMMPAAGGFDSEIGDLIFLDAGEAKPASAQADAGTLAANQEGFHDKFLGVAMQASPAGTAEPIRIATSGVFDENGFQGEHRNGLCAYSVRMTKRG